MVGPCIALLQTTGMKYRVGLLSGGDRKVVGPGQGLVGRTLVGRPPCIWAASPSMTRWPPLRLTRVG
jgi:hypothetical protein